jgi:murE/murF fusion protein
VSLSPFDPRAVFGFTPAGVADDSRAVRKGDLFAAYPLHGVDRRAFIPDALARGATAVAWEPGAGFAWPPEWRTPNCAVRNLRAQVGALAHELADDPSAAVDVLAVTGTNGKTTISQWLAQSLPHPCIAVGTLGAGFPGALAATGFTTPEATTLARLLADACKKGARACALEASSIGIAEGRLDGCRIDTAIFSNFTHDHLDYHGNMAAYAAAKEKLFQWPGLRLAVVNLDDALGRRIARETRAEKVVGTTRFGQAALPVVVGAENVRVTRAGQAFCLITPQGRADVRTRLIGAYNVDNLLAVAAVLLERGLTLAAVVEKLETLTPPPGRMERYGGEGEPLVMVDYAHTPDALENALVALRPIATARGGNLVCLFGCGGDRDRTKRPEMGEVAARLADGVCLANDNPRGENPGDILREILAGVREEEARANVAEIPDRACAIRQIVWRAKPEDVILLAGKGHEAHQEIAGVFHPFRDGEKAENALAARRAGAMRWNLAEIADVLEAELLNTTAAAEIIVEGIATDTRADCSGKLFVALKGENFDAHDYLDKAVAQGAKALLVSRAEAVPAGVPAVRVDEPRLALGRLAARWRQFFQIPLIALTGSNGKTTTREMLVRILRTAYGEAAVLATEGNYNNDIGMPLTLLRLAPQHKVAVIEMGMNHPGEIESLTQIARPDVALITNAGRAHLEGMGDLEGVAREKGSIYNGLSSNGIALINEDDPHAGLWRELNRQREVLGFALERQSDVGATLQTEGLRTRMTLRCALGSVDIHLGVPGKHNARNALAAAATAIYALRPFAAAERLAFIERGLEAFAGVNGRLQPRQGAGGATVLDDSYNANPDSVRAGIEVLAGLAGQRILVLGDMGEIGAEGARLHAEAGEAARQAGVDKLYALGAASAAAVETFGADARHFTTPEALVAALKPELDAHTVVLVKGSRFMKMERIVAELLDIRGRAD